MWGDLAKLVVALKSCPKSNKSPNLVALLALCIESTMPTPLHTNSHGAL